MEDRKLSMDKKWRELGFKDKAQYVTAMSLIASGITIAFASFFVLLLIPDSVLIYIAQAFVAGGSIFGVSIYFKNQLDTAKEDTARHIEKKIEEYVGGKLAKKPEDSDEDNK